MIRSNSITYAESFIRDIKRYICKALGKAPFVRSKKEYKSADIVFYAIDNENEQEKNTSEKLYKMSRINIFLFFMVKKSKTNIFSLLELIVLVFRLVNIRYE